MAAVYNFKSHHSGDTFNGITFTFPDNYNFNNAIIEINTDVRKYDLSTTNGTITIIDNKSFKINSQIINWIPRTYIYRLNVTFSNGLKKTYLTGKWQII